MEVVNQRKNEVNSEKRNQNLLGQILMQLNEMSNWIVEEKKVELDQMIEELETIKIVPCDKVQWSLLGISMAGYSALASLGLGLISLFTALKACDKN